MLSLRNIYCTIVVLLMMPTYMALSDDAVNDGINAQIAVGNTPAVILVGGSETYSLTCTSDSTPLITDEYKPGTAEWKSGTFSSNNSGVTMSQTDSYGTDWTTQNTRSIKATTTSSTTTGDYDLTFTMQVRFPKLKKSDGTQLNVNGVAQYFGPYTLLNNSQRKNHQHHYQKTSQRCRRIHANLRYS